MMEMFYASIMVVLHDYVFARIQRTDQLKTGLILLYVNYTSINVA